MAENGNSEELKTQQQRVIAALLSTKSIAEAAKVTGQGERTIHRWLAEDPAFRVALSQAEGQAIDAATRQLISLQDDAIDVLRKTMKSRAATAQDKLRAATSVLNYLLKLRELRNVEERLAALESALAGRRG